MANKDEKDTSTASTSDKSFPYPSCWTDDVRMQVLFAPFRDRSVNADHFHSKMKFWKDLIRDYCVFKGKATFCKQELQTVFARGARTPACLDVVIEDMKADKLIRLRSDYEYDPLNSWSGWAVNGLLRRPLHWGQTRLKTFLGSADLEHLGLLEFVHIAVIEQFSHDVQALLSEAEYAGKLFHYDRLARSAVQQLHLTNDCFRLCLLALKCRGKVGIENKPDGCNNAIHLVKIPSTTDPSVIVTETDYAVHNLLVTRDNLMQQLETLETQISDNESRARLCVMENKRMLAKRHLRMKHLLEKNHEKRSLALHNIETLLSEVENAIHNGIVLDAYKFGSKALQNALKTANLTYDNVDEVVSDVRETLDAAKELGDSLSGMDTTLTSAENQSLELELKQLVSNIKEEQTSESNLPESPAPVRVEITDAELLAMLEDLEVEDETPLSNTTPGKMSTTNGKTILG